MFDYFLLEPQVMKNILVFKNNPSPKDKFQYFNVQYYDITFQQLSKRLEGVLFERVRRLRLFSVEGVELFEEDMKYLKPQITLIASNDGGEFDVMRSLQEYKIIAVLREGLNGKILKAKNLFNKETRTLKYIYTSNERTAEDIEMTFREAEVLQLCDHQNIVKIYNCFTLHNMQVALIMEYLEGGSLQDYFIQKGRLEEEEAKLLLQQIVDAIQYCHFRNIIHRDLRLENIMFVNKQCKQTLKLKINDFGISSVNMRLNFLGDKFQNLNYMAPELLISDHVGAAGDLWAIGIIMYTILFGKQPYQGQTPEEVEQRILEEPLPFDIPVQISRDCMNLLNRLTDKNPITRITATQTLEHPWFQQVRKAKLKQNQERQNLMEDIILKRTSIRLIRDQKDEKEKNQSKHNSRAKITSSKNIQPKNESQWGSSKNIQRIQQIAVQTESKWRKPSITLRTKKEKHKLEPIKYSPRDRSSNSIRCTETGTSINERQSSSGETSSPSPKSRKQLLPIIQNTIKVIKTSQTTQNSHRVRKIFMRESRSTSIEQLHERFQESYQRLQMMG